MKIKSFFLALMAVAVAFGSADAASIAEQIANRNATVIAAPDFTKKKPAKIPTTGPLKFVKAAQNKIIDEDRWLAENAGGQADPVKDKAESLGFPTTVEGSSLYQLVCDNAGDKYIAMYGYFEKEPLRMIITNGERTEVEHYLNFENFKWTPVKGTRYAYSNLFLKWARVVDDVLYVSYGHNTYASSSEGMTGYITAISLKDYSILWTSGSTTSYGSFDFSYNRIIVGYGFTDEPDFVYVLDKKTGKYIQQFKLRKGPDYIVVRGDNVYVRTYSLDYTFRIRAGVSGK